MEKLFKLDWRNFTGKKLRQVTENYFFDSVQLEKELRSKEEEDDNIEDIDFSNVDKDFNPDIFRKPKVGRKSPPATGGVRCQ